ncbi:class B sortase [Lachnospiraceae bacterium 56-18]
MDYDKSNHKNHSRVKKRKSSGNTRLLLAIVAIVIVVVAGTGIGIYIHSSNQKKEAAAAEKAKKADPEATQEQYEKLKEQVAVDADDPMFRKIDFAAAQAANPDVYAWIWIPGTNIDYPILQSESEDDAYYLNHTIEKKEGLPGTIYTEKYNAKDFTSPVTVVYGHNMKNGSMFADLHKFEDKAFFDANPYVYIYLPDRTIKYRIFAATPFDDRYILGNYVFTSQDDFEKYLDELRSNINGNVNMDVNVAQTTGIITLSTCIADSPNERFLVNATQEQ